MKTILSSIIIACLLSACSQKKASQTTGLPIQGTWQLLTGTLIQNGDTVVTNYTGKQSFIKIINDSHFAFLLHDLAKGKDSSAVYASGGGRYSLRDSTYTEHLAYCSDRNWEGNDFVFTVRIHNDTLVQRGIEKIAGSAVNRLNIETYVRTGKQ